MNRMPPTAGAIDQIPLFRIAKCDCIINSLMFPGLLVDHPHASPTSEFKLTSACHHVTSDLVVLAQRGVQRQVVCRRGRCRFTNHNLHNAIGEPCIA